jgi:hypothetical protein
LAGVSTGAENRLGTIGTLCTVTDALSELTECLEGIVQRLRADELEPDAVLALVEECARLATEASAELGQRARAALEPLPDLPGQLPLPAG